MRKNNPQFSLVTLHPSFVLGHSLIQNTAEEVGGINALFWGSLQTEKPQFPPLFVDVLDVADAHLKATMISAKDQTTEFLLSGSGATWDQVLAFIKSEFPQVGPGWVLPFARGAEVDTSRAEKVLGMQWRPVEEIFRSLISQQLDLQKK